MSRRDRRRASALARAGVRSATPQISTPKVLLLGPGRADRKSLLLGTALASTLLVAVMTAPTPAHAVVDCLSVAPPSPGAITVNDSDDITCVNTEPRESGPGNYAIYLRTFNSGDFDIYLNNSGPLTATNAAGAAYGIHALTDGVANDIDVVNSGSITVTATGANARGIRAFTNLDDSTIGIVNSGDITATSPDQRAYGLYARTLGTDSTVYIANTGDITATSTDQSAWGIFSRSRGDDSTIGIVNAGDITVTGGTGSDAYGIYAYQDSAPSVRSAFTISNSGNISAVADVDAYGIWAFTQSAESPVTITNSGALSATATTGDAMGIRVRTNLDNSTIDIVNSARITASSAGEDAVGIFARSFGADSGITITNSGDFRTTTTTTMANNAYGIYARTRGTNSGITITNSGDLTSIGVGIAYGIRTEVNRGDSATRVDNSGHIVARSTGYNAYGIYARTVPDAAEEHFDITITNRGDMDIVAANHAYGIVAYSFSSDLPNSPIRIDNSGDLTVTGIAAYGIVTRASSQDSAISVNNSGGIRAAASNGLAYGIRAESEGENSAISVTSSGRITANSIGDIAHGVYALTEGSDSLIAIVNSGEITALGGSYATAIHARTEQANSPITINNSGKLKARTTSPLDYATGIYAVTGFSPITITNSGSIHAEGNYSTGIFAYSFANVLTTIINTGDIGASSHLAIDVYGFGTSNIYNAGTITGYVKLTDRRDRFFNQAGGVWETKKTSFFGDGNDLFVNQAGGTVLAATDSTRSETSAIEGLETFRNRGLISMVDGRPGDSFTISNTPGGTDLDFVASDNSRLAVDAFLGGPGKSRSDTFTVEGSVSGTTTVGVVNTSFGPGVFNPEGMRVVTVTGATPNENAFQLDQSIDTGFFNYDLFFTPTGSGFWELRSFAGPGAFLLPQLVTAAQDIWHQSSSTWFDRTADLRVLMAGGAAPTAYDPGGASLGASGPYPLTPAVWARGSGSWLDRDGTQRTTAYGRDYAFDMDRELDTLDFQVGVDMGKRDVWGQGDALVFGLLGGFVHGDLDYDALARAFNFDGGQVGAYATYLNGGLFVDTLLNVHLYSLDTNTLGFPDSLDANTVGLRSDTGYRFGSFSGGPFIEPLATIEVMWADIDGFSLGGNSVSFGDDANVRGRLGLRAGTTTEAWDGTLMEPFVIGSLWGNLTDDNSATLVSTGRTFRFEDQLQDVWGEISAGVNFFNFTQTTAVFAKVDVTFGDDLTGLGGKAGMRVNW
jgi:Autotransporter beta-domain/Autochaperone Domain Type 1